MTPFDPMTGIPGSVFEERRKAVFAALGQGVMVLPAAPLLYRSRDTEIPYRPDSELFYLSGATEPGTVAVLVGGETPRFILFVRERNPDQERWSGPRLGPSAAAERFGAEACHPVSEMESQVPTLFQGADRLHVRLGVHPWLDRMVIAALEEARARGPRQGRGPRGVTDPGGIVDELRLIKDAHEIERLRVAAALSAQGHRAAAASVRPGAGEWEVQAAVEAVFRRGGGSGPGYATIVGSGPNACVLHYVANGRVMEAGDLVLVDAGAEVGLYQGDISRVYPADGAFTGAQKDIYQIVDAARAASVASVAPGVTLAHVHETATRVLVEGLVALGVLSGGVDELLATEAHKAFYPHQTSHWLGLDVHDPGDYARGGAARALEPGMVFSVEPGLYFPPGLDGAGSTFAGIGVRIEDDVLVTDHGCENLTAALPTALADIEALMREVG